MKQIIYKNLHLMLGCCFILFAYPVARFFSTETIDYSELGNTYLTDTVLAFYLTISFWMVGIILCFFKKTK